MTQPPLSERVTAPVDLQPHEVPGVTWRPATTADVDAVTELFAAMSTVDHPDWAETRDDVEQDFTHSWVRLEKDTLLAHVDGRLVAFGQVLAPPEPETIMRTILLGGVHPEFRGRGVGRALVAWQVGRARQVLAASELTMRGWILAGSEDRNVGADRLLTRAGFVTQRYFWQLQRVLSEPIPDLDLPQPLVLANLSPELSEATRVAKNSAFRDHWGSQPTTEEGWASFMSLPSRRLDLSFVAGDGEEVVGTVIAETTESDWELQGFRGSYIAVVGVVAEWRRRGVAPALLAASLRAAREAGLERAVLDVDSASPTGATGPYTGMGFTQSSGSKAHVIEF